ncbi:hypothetical protein Bca4012_066271 [Brassica carinata]|uniref:Uncharacterized protein n=1 Tax=Brassica carinata TaxID=52824 RepID=A0A8X7VQB6_BRACI|nr:hypothetical protein Bca52824_018583 [Brassica carinata]
MAFGYNISLFVIIHAFDYGNGETMKIVEYSEACADESHGCMAVPDNKGQSLCLCLQIHMGSRRYVPFKWAQF